MRWRRNLPLMVLLAIGIPDGQTADVPPPDGQPPASIRQSPGASPLRNAPQITEYVILKRPTSSRFYPSLSIKLREQGYVRIKICFDTRGKPVRTTVLESSRFARLDEAAVKMGGKYRIKPPMVDKVPVAICVSQRIEFTVRDKR
jgi:protein TonB